MPTALSVLQGLSDIASDPLVWIGAGGLLLLLALWAQTRALARRLGSIERNLDALEDLSALEQLDFLELLEPLESRVARLSASRVELDLKPLERVLTDIRDGQRRVEMRLVSMIESLDLTREAVITPVPPPHAGEPARPTVGALADRITDRLLALGYDRIDFVTSPDELELSGAKDGEVRVEARRDGAPHKGRVVIKDGRITDVALRSSYEIFP